MITIVKVYDKQVVGTHREYCGRPGKGQLGLLGNPFAANVTHSNRDEVCDKYKEYFENMLLEQAPKFSRKIQELIEIAKTQDIELACFCQSPYDVVKKRCHTETIKQYIEEQLEPTMCYHNGEWVDASTLVMSDDTYTPNKEGERFYNQTDGKY